MRNFPATWVGFENLFNDIERLTREAVPSWPPCNIKKVADDKFIIELAVAGFGTSDIELTTQGSELIVKGSVKPDTSAHYIHKGIAERSFERTFTIADTVVVKNASMVNGMLRVFLENIIPEEKKPRKIEVTEATSSDLNTLNQKALSESTAT